MGTASELDLKYRDVRCSHSEGLPELLSQLRLSVLISTYQTGHLVVVAARRRRLVLTFHQFDRAMGIAVKPRTIAICTRKEVWFAREAPDIAAKLEPRGEYDACFLARSSHFTDDIQAHEAAWVGNEVWVVNTLFSCLAALHPIYSFAPRWRPPFVTELRPEDRCHLNGMAVVDGQPRYVTALSETDAPQGWREVKATGGCLIEVPSRRVVLRGLSLPHSPRVDGAMVYLLQSGLGQLDRLDLSDGTLSTVAVVPGIARGLTLHGGYAFIGLSRPRPSLEGVPIVQDRDRLECGLRIVDLRTGADEGYLRFHTGVEEVFDVQVLPDVMFPYVSGPSAERDTGQPLWTVPPRV
jgi:uncharacterized protein (TIGR03032 family)